MFRTLFDKVKHFISTLSHRSPAREFSAGEKDGSAPGQAVPPSEIDDETAAEVVATWNLLNPP